MKLIKYKIICNTVNEGTTEEPVYKNILLEKKLTYSGENLVIAQNEAYKGEYTIIDDGKPEPEEIVLPIELGGTGAKTAKEALKNLGVPNVASGSYVGTGVYGSDNLNSLTFDFIPKIVFVQNITDGNSFGIFHYGVNECTLACEQNGTSLFASGRSTWGEKTLSWFYTSSYSYNAKMQLNVLGETYTWVAIG